jgi:hypothetical protein
MFFGHVASVAGAYNCLSNLSRENPKALTHEDILDIYREMFLEMIKMKIASFERMLSAPFMPLLYDVEAELSRTRKVIGGKKVDGANKTHVLRAVRAIAQRHRAVQQLQPSSTGGGSGGIVLPAIPSPKNIHDSLVVDSWDAIVELYTLDGDNLMPEPETAEERVDARKDEIETIAKKWDEMVEEDESVIQLQQITSG